MEDKNKRLHKENIRLIKRNADLGVTIKRLDKEVEAVIDRINIIKTNEAALQSKVNELEAKIEECPVCFRTYDEVRCTILKCNHLECEECYERELLE